MNELQRERENLILADQHLTAGERRIADQFALIRAMTLQGYDTALAYDLLQALEDTLAAWQGHRQLIVSAIARLEQAASLPRMSPKP
jgi:hypothetical protein